jgi:hypothetical protein
VSQAREQVLGAAIQPELLLTRLSHAGAVADTGKPTLSAVPEFILDDAQFRHFSRDPLTLEIDARQALARVRVLDVALLVRPT